MKSVTSESAVYYSGSSISPALIYNAWILKKLKEKREGEGGGGKEGVVLHHYICLGETCGFMML